MSNLSVDQQIEAAMLGHDLKTEEGFEAAVRSLVEVLKQLPSDQAVESVYLQQVAHRLGQRIRESE